MGFEFLLDVIDKLQCVDGESIINVVCVFMDPVDNPTFPLRPIDEPGMEEINTIGFGEYDYYSGGVIVVEEVEKVGGE